MTHTLHKEFMGTVELDNEPMPLLAHHSIVIPALCVGTIPHGVELISTGEGNSWIMLVREPHVWLTNGLMVDQGPVEPGHIITTVFNITNREVKIRKGEVVSRLIRVEGARWKQL